MRRVKIITHPGKAHRDEFLACAVAAFSIYRSGSTATIERRIAGDSDLDSSSVWVIDTGMRWDAQNLNFDHHQEDAQVEGRCALDLVLLHVLDQRAYDMFRLCNPWLRTTALHDNTGAVGAAKALGMDVKSYLGTRSPLEKAALARFGEHSVIHPGSQVMGELIDTGRVLVCEAETMRHFDEEVIPSLSLPFEHLGVRVWDVRAARLEDETISTAMLNHAAAGKSVDIVVSSSTRNANQVGLYRQPRASGRLDFSKLTGLPGVNFAHKNGFYAVLDGATDQSILDCIEKSMS